MGGPKLDLEPAAARTPTDPAEDLADRSTGWRLQRVQELAVVLEDSTVSSEIEARWFDGIADLIIDAVAAQDHESLVAVQNDVIKPALAVLQREAQTASTEKRAGHLLGLWDTARFGMLRTASSALSQYMVPQRDSHAARFLRVVAQEPGISNQELAARISELAGGKRVDETQVSRLGRDLRTQGLAKRYRTGAYNAWHLTPRGNRALDALEKLSNRDL